MLVFQYGSNCLESRINSEDRLSGDARFVGIAETIEDYELAFDVYSTKNNCAASNMVRKQGSKVWGALYEVPDYLITREAANARGRKSFDQIEGKSYGQQTIRVRCQDGEITQALTYTVRSPVNGLKTNIDYVRYIVQGLRERGISGEYITKVKAIAASNNPAIATDIERL